MPPPPPATPRAEEDLVIEPFDVEFYRTLSSGLPGEIFKAAMFTPQMQPKHERRTKKPK